ncbi:hypothetical protein KI387_037088, partial [Taxus chinensis]
ANHRKIMKETDSAKAYREERQMGELARNEGSISGRFRTPLADPSTDKHGRNLCPNPHQGRVSSFAAARGVSGGDGRAAKDGECAQGYGSFKSG